MQALSSFLPLCKRICKPGFGVLSLMLILMLTAGEAAHAGMLTGKAGSAVVEYSVAEPWPTGEVRMARPTIAWRVVPLRGSRVTAVTMSLNGRPVPTRYDSARYSALHTPEAALTPGRYAVRCTVTLDRDYTLSKEWEFRVRAGSAPEAAAPNAAQMRVCDEVNTLRRWLNLPEATRDIRLCAAANSHSDYLFHNAKSPAMVAAADPHTQSATLPHFVAASADERAVTFGYAGGCLEGVSRGEGAGGVTQAVRRLFDAPYHRPLFLQPGPFEVGAGVHGDVVTLLVGASDTAGVVTYPVDGQREVPLSWNGVEAPDPLRIHPQAPPTPARGGIKPIGYPISLHVFGGATAADLRLTSVRAHLETADGKPVTTYVNTPDNDDMLQSGVLLIPVRPLLPGTTYRATVEATDTTGAKLSRNWTFTTVPPVAAPRTRPNPSVRSVPVKAGSVKAASAAMVAPRR